MDLKSKIRTVPDFPKKGIMFRDITTLLQDSSALRESVKQLVEKVKGKEFDLVVAVESRGFIFGSLVAYELGAGFVPVRKPGKLPFETVKQSYELEYGVDALEMHLDAVKEGQKVLVVDDLLATGGTAKATAELVEQSGGKIKGFLFLIELDFLNGREKLKEYEVQSIIRYDSE